jgi:hypothetical protein
MRAAVAREPLDPTDVDRAHGRNLELRALLAELVPVAFRWDAEETDARVVAHLRERARRYPFATV